MTWRAPWRCCIPWPSGTPSFGPWPTGWSWPSFWAARGVRLVISGSREDQDLGRLIARRAELGSDLVDLTGRTSLKELAALLTLANAVVCTDTGVMHLAAAMGAKLVALFGPTAPWRTGPHGSGHVVLRAGLDCSPCFERFCGDLKCMKQISPAQAARPPWV